MNALTRKIINFADGSWGPENAPSPIDCAWRTRIPVLSIAQEAKRAAHVRPFRFEDLNGKPEPEKWGPVYPKTASASVEKWRRISRGRELTASEGALYGQAVHAWINGLKAPKKAPNTLSATSNCASGQANEFSAAKHRAKLIGQLHSRAAIDRAAWATGARGSHGRDIRQAYEAAMEAKRARLAREAAAHAALNKRLELAEAA